MDKIKGIRDIRGIIEDLKVGNDYSVTYITFNPGAVRGNHYHKETTQVDILLSGKLLAKTDKGETILNKGGIVTYLPNTPHAYQAIEKSEMASICFGKRIGKNYAKDTFKLETPL